MTNAKAIKRKLIYQVITLIIVIVLFIVYCNSVSDLAVDYVYFSSVFVPIFVSIILCKFTRTIVYILNIHNSDVEFEKYSDTKKALSTKSKIMNIFVLLLTIVFIITVLANCGFNYMFFYADGYEKMEKDNGLDVFSFSNFTNLNENEMTLDSERYDYGKSFASMGYNKRLNYSIQDNYYILTCCCMKNCPKWAVENFYKKNIYYLNNSQVVMEDKTTIYEINQDGVKGVYSLNDAKTQVKVYVYKDDDFLRVYIGDGGNEIVKVDYQAVIDSAIEWVKNN